VSQGGILRAWPFGEAQSACLGILSTNRGWQILPAALEI